MRRKIKIAFIIFVGILILIQLYPVDRPDNQPVPGYDFFADNQVPSEVGQLLRSACFDCHSQETRYPWYSKIAPASWLLARDVKRGRASLDFSLWQSLNKREKLNLLDEIYDEIHNENMPMPIYLFMHPEARLSNSDREKIKIWAENFAEEIFDQ